LPEIVELGSEAREFVVRIACEVLEDEVDLVVGSVVELVSNNGVVVSRRPVTVGRNTEEQSSVGALVGPWVIGIRSLGGECHTNDIIRRVVVGERNLSSSQPRSVGAVVGGQSVDVGINSGIGEICTNVGLVSRSSDATI